MSKDVNNLFSDWKKHATTVYTKWPDCCKISVHVYTYTCIPQN